MKKQAIIVEKVSLKPFFWVLMCGLALTSSVGTAKSLYVAGSSEFGNQDRLWVYDVRPDGKLVFQVTSRMDDGGSLNVNGLTLDPDSQTLLMTYTEFSNASAVDSQSLELEKFIYLTPWDMFAGGIVYDQARARVYVTEANTARRTNRLLIYDWISETQELRSAEIYGASDVPLNRENAGALAFDPDRELVYVASLGSDIEVMETAFDLDDWQSVGSIESTYEVQTLSVDSRKQYLYTAGSSMQGAVITQRNLVTGTERQIAASSDQDTVLSLSVDNATSLLYALIGRAGALSRTIRVYGPALQVIQEVDFTGDALVLHVSSAHAGYNPLNVTMTPTSGAVRNNGRYVASPGSEVYYEICMNNTNLFPITEIVGADTLPVELEFVRAEDLGDAFGFFDASSNTYLYNNVSLESNTTECFILVARIRENTAPGTVITNSIVIDSNEAGQSVASVDIEVGYNTLGLDKTVVMDPNYLQVGRTIYVDAGATVTYQLCVNNLNNQHAVHNVKVIDQLPDSVDFVSAEQAGSTSGYDASTHSYSWTFDVVEPNYLECFDITVRIKDGVPPGQLISNEAWMGGSDTDTVTTHTDVVVKYDALDVNISIANNGDYNPGSGQIAPGSVLTYIIDVNNFEPLYPAQNVVVIDSVPEGLQFMGAFPGDANGVWDEQSRTYRYQQPVVKAGEGIHLELTFLVDADLPGGTVLVNSVVALANGAPASTDSVTVTVREPGAGFVPTTLDLFYTMPLRQDNADDIMAVMRLPDFIAAEDIDTAQALMMTPGPSPAFYIDSVEEIPTIYYSYIGYDGSLNVKGFFNRNLVLSALFPGQESVTITVTGSLRSGQRFEGQATVPVN